MSRQSELKKRSKARQKSSQPAKPKSKNSAAKSNSADLPAKDQSWQVTKPVWIAAVGLSSLVFLWSYWPVLVDLVNQWNRIPDYSHGFLVIPLACWFLWMTKESFPGIAPKISWAGAILILVAGAIRIVGAYYYLDTLHGWSIPFWVAGFVWMFFGWRTLIWSLPAIGFLVFMVPLPYTLEHMLSQPLQMISTKISVFILQCLGQPAVAEGTTIVLPAKTLEVERACSGLRIFFGITALAYAFVVLFKRPFLTRLLIALSILPIALLANSIRIVATGLMYQMGMSELAEHLSHDFAGWFMIPLAAGFFALVLVYLDKLFPVVQTVEMGSLVRQQTERHKIK